MFQKFLNQEKISGIHNIFLSYTAQKHHLPPMGRKIFQIKIWIHVVIRDEKFQFQQCKK